AAVHRFGMNDLEVPVPEYVPAMLRQGLAVGRELFRYAKLHAGEPGYKRVRSTSLGTSRRIGDSTTRMSSSKVSRPRSKARSWSALRQMPFDGSARRAGAVDQGRM